MYITELRWSVKENLGIVKIMGVAPLQGNPEVDLYVQSHMLNKMVELQEKAEKLNGKPMSVQPNFPKINSTIHVLFAAYFHLTDEKEEFKKQCKQILKQG